MTRGGVELFILAIAAVVRMAVVMATPEPVLSDDLWRYLHDGRVLSLEENPYRLSPEAWGEEREARGQTPWGEGALHRVNNPELVTIYQPTSQHVFAALTPADLWSSGWNQPFRYGMAGFDLTIVAVVLWGLRRAGLSPWWACVYAWHPLTVAEVAWSGHQDVIGIVPLAAALVVCEGRRWLVGRGGAAGVLLALAVGVKPIVAPLALTLAWKHRREPVAVLAAGCACVAMLAALYLPFALMEGGLWGMLETSRTFVDKWAFNASAHAALQWATGEKAYADVMCGLALLGVLLWVALARLDVVQAAIAYLLAALLLSSTAHPWYLLWALALTPLRPAFALSPIVWIWSVTIGLGYTAIGTSDFKPPTWAVWVEYVPVYAALGWIALSRKRLIGWSSSSR